jgi:hypothetical protein
MYFDLFLLGIVREEEGGLRVDKYNKLDSKQLSYFKINADNVNYNFPILMVIFLIVLGEPIFIKS